MLLTEKLALVERQHWLDEVVAVNLHVELLHKVVHKTLNHTKHECLVLCYFDLIVFVRLAPHIGANVASPSPLDAS